MYHLYRTQTAGVNKPKIPTTNQAYKTNTQVLLYVQWYTSRGQYYWVFSWSVTWKDGVMSYIIIKQNKSKQTWKIAHSKITSVTLVRLMIRRMVWCFTFWFNDY